MAGVSISQRSRTRRAAKRDPRKLCVGKNPVMKYSPLRFSVSLKLCHLESNFAQHTYTVDCEIYYVILCILYHDYNHLCIYMHQLISPVCPMRCIPWRPHNRDPRIGSALVRIFHCKAFLHNIRAIMWSWWADINHWYKIISWLPVNSELKKINEFVTSNEDALYTSTKSSTVPYIPLSSIFFAASSRIPDADAD